MKKAIQLSFAAALFATSAAVAAPTQTAVVKNVRYGGIEQTNAQNTYRLNYQNDPARDYKILYPWYVSGALALNFNTLKIDQSIDGDLAGSDKFSWKNTTGFELMAGYQLTPRWRAELNYGSSGKFETKDDVQTFSISSQHFMANALYTIKRWFSTSVYAGAGAGAAIISTEWTGVPGVFLDNNNDNKKTTFAGQAILGIEQDIISSLSLVAEYRLRYIGGATYERKLDPGLGVGDMMSTKQSGTLTNSIVVGAKLKF
jgi:opacity protein-like surface antigen